MEESRLEFIILPISKNFALQLAHINSSNRITTAGWEYDSAGNQTGALAEDARTWLKFEYDAANRLRLVKRDDTEAEEAREIASLFVPQAKLLM